MKIRCCLFCYTAVLAYDIKSVELNNADTGVSTSHTFYCMASHETLNLISTI